MIKNIDVVPITTAGIAGVARREEWLPINRKDEDIDIVVRIYVPDLEKMKTWTPPKAEKVGSK